MKTTQDGLGRDPLQGQAAQQSPSPDGLGPSGEHPSRMQWQPIETARGAEAVLLYWPPVVIRPGRGGHKLPERIGVDWVGLTPNRKPSHWMPLPPAPAIEAQGAETRSGSVEDESAIGKAEAPANSVLLSALKAMDAALTERWTDPGSYNAIQELWGGATEAWIQIRSAIAQGDGQ